VFAVGGLIAGPISLLLIVVQIFTRPGFDFTHQPISLLSLGNDGWIQIAGFLGGGLLVAGLAIATRRMLRQGLEDGLAALFIGCFGIGLILAGLFPPDPAFGFPPGTPEGMPKVITHRSVIHGIGFMLSFLGLTAACVATARRDAKAKNWWQVWYSLATAVASLALSQWPGLQGASLRYFLAAVLAWAWISTHSIRLILMGSQHPST